jgi:hypothetical protein
MVEEKLRVHFGDYRGHADLLIDSVLAVLQPSPLQANCCGMA